MPENTNSAPILPSTNPAGDVSAQSYYEKMRKQLRELIQKRREIEQALASQEDLIAKKEQEYLDETPMGNIIAGFDNYTKGGLVSGRRRGREEEERERRLRVFSRSSVSWNPNAEQHDMDQTTINIVANSTPQSTISQKVENPVTNGSSMTGSKGALYKKNKKGPEDSDGEGRESKKPRINFGVVKK